jgi:transketolase
MPELDADRLYAAAEQDFARYEQVKELIDECIDLSLNYRQSGHPGGSRSKVHMLLALLLSGAMRWDVLRPWRRFGDRFVLSAGHTVPLVYATLAVLNEAIRARHDRSGEPQFSFPSNGDYALTWEWLLRLRRHGGLPGHAEMEGKTLFLKFNTGPSGHGMPPAAGEALALKLAGAGDVRVFVFEGEGGLTPGSAHETKNTAWGLGLDNLVFMLDWNDFGIDPRPLSSVVSGGPSEWFAPYGWRVLGTPEGMSWGPVVRTVLDTVSGIPDAGGVPSVAWFKTVKGRGYGKEGAPSHGTPWAMNAPEFWAVRERFMKRHGVSYEGFGSAAPASAEEVHAQASANLRIVMEVLRRDADLVTWLSDRLLAVAGTVPSSIEGCSLGSGSVFRDQRLFDVAQYPSAMWKKPGEKAPNRAGLGAWGAYVNSLALREHGRPLFIAASADLAESTNIAGFGKDFNGSPGTGWFSRESNPRGALLPTEITEFTNAGLVAGLASVNLASDPFVDYDGFWGACSTYGSFSYLKYGPMRLFSQLAQDCELRVGKVLWVAGHSGPETAEDSRTHFGIFSIGVTQLFPEGHVIDLHPWEYNEVPVVLGTAFGLSAGPHIVALHLTRPSIEIPDRFSLGIPSHFEAARGAYLIRDYVAGVPRSGTVYVRGTMPTRNLVSVLPMLESRGINVRIVAAISPQLFALQPSSYRSAVVGPDPLSGRLDAMVITNGAVKLMGDWASGPLVREYSLSSDWDDRWRTGGSVDEVIAEAHLDADTIVAAIERFAVDRPDRLRRLREALDA